MNLQEILSYRDRCIHCDRELVMRIKRYPKLLINIDKEGLKIGSGRKNGVYLNFGFDGTYERNKRDYEIHKRPVIIQRRCQSHPMIDAERGYIVPSKQKNVGPGAMVSGPYLGTTINTMYNTVCQYDFMLYGDSQGNYDAKLASDFIFWHDSTEFWHTNTYFTNEETHLYHGRYEQKLEEVLRQVLPAMNLRNVKTKDQFIQKLKLYNLFS